MHRQGALRQLLALVSADAKRAYSLKDVPSLARAGLVAAETLAKNPFPALCLQGYLSKPFLVLQGFAAALGPFCPGKRPGVSEVRFIDNIWAALLSEYLHGFGIAIAIFSDFINSLLRLAVFVVQLGDFLGVRRAVPVLAVLYMLVEVRLQSFEVQKSSKCRLVLLNFGRCVCDLNRPFECAGRTEHAELTFATQAKLLITPATPVTER